MCEGEDMKSKRYRIKSKFRFTVFVAAMVVSMAFITSTFLGFDDASSLSEEPSYVRVEVQAGDTLWNIASEYGPDNKDRREIVYAICQLNEIHNINIQPGQSILIPTQI